MKFYGVTEKSGIEKVPSIASYRDEGIFTNSAMSASQIARFCRIDSELAGFMNKIIDRLQLSARAYGRILKLSRTIADLAGKKEIDLQCVSEAIQFRNLDRYDAR